LPANVRPAHIKDGAKAEAASVRYRISRANNSLTVAPGSLSPEQCNWLEVRCWQRAALLLRTVFCQRLLCLMASTIDRGRRVNSIRRSRRDQAVSPAGGARRATKTKVRGLTPQVLTEDEPAHGCVRVIRPSRADDRDRQPRVVDGLLTDRLSPANSGSTAKQLEADV